MMISGKSEKQNEMSSSLGLIWPVNFRLGTVMKTEKRLLKDIIRINLQLSLRLLKLMIHLLLRKEHTGCIELPHSGELEAVLCDNYPA